MPEKDGLDQRGTGNCDWVVRLPTFLFYEKIRQSHKALIYR
jgi:hypothetical protein